MNLKKENVYIKVEKIPVMIFYKIFYYYFSIGQIIFFLISPFISKIKNNKYRNN